MNTLFEASYRVAWGDIDMNGHMANSRFLDYATQTRFQFLAMRGFMPADFQRLQVGPVIFEDHVRYRRELRMLEDFVVSFQYEPLDPQGRKFKMLNRFSKGDEAVAEVEALGAWFDLVSRKVVVPPLELANALGGAEP